MRPPQHLNIGPYLQAVFSEVKVLKRTAMRLKTTTRWMREDRGRIYALRGHKRTKERKLDSETIKENE